MENSMEVPQNTEDKSTYNPAISLLGIYPDKTIIQKDTRTPVFTTALFTVAKARKQPKCPLADEWTKMRYIYTHSGILLSHKKEWNNAICSNTDAIRDHHTKWSKSEREKQIPTWNLKHDTDEPFTKERQAHRTHSRNRNRLPDIENRFVVIKERVGDRRTDGLELVDAGYYT